MTLRQFGGSRSISLKEPVIMQSHEYGCEGFKEALSALPTAQSLSLSSLPLDIIFDSRVCNHHVLCINRHETRSRRKPRLLAASDPFPRLLAATSTHAQSRALPLPQDHPETSASARRIGTVSIEGFLESTSILPDMNDDIQDTSP